MSQLLTLFWLRFVIFRNSLTGRREVVSTMLRLMILAGYLMLSLSAGLILFLIMVKMPETVGHWMTNSMGTLFGMLVFLTLVTQATGTSANFDPRRYILFPISFRKLFALNLISAFSEPVMITLLPSVGGILLGRGVALAQPLAGLIAFVCAVVWVDALFVFVALLTAWLLSGRRRRTEIFFTVLIGLFLLSGQLLPRLIDTSVGNGLLELTGPYRRIIGEVLVWTPFGMWREFYAALEAGRLLEAYRQMLSVIVVWTGAVWLAGYGIFKRLATSARSGTSGSPRDALLPAPSHRMSLKLPFVSEQLSVIFAREIIYLLRNTVTWLNTANILVITLIAFNPGRRLRNGEDHLFETLNRGQADWREFWWMTLLISYASLVNHQHFSAIFAFDSSGFRQYLLTPVRWRRVLLGKNLAACCIVALQICLILAGTQLLYDGLTGQKIWLIFCTSLTAMSVGSLVGNLLSIQFPYPADFGVRRRRAQGSYGTLIAFLWLLLILALCGLFAVPVLLGWLLLSVTVKNLAYALIAAASCALYLLSLSRQARLLEAKQFDIAEALTRRTEKA
ncbi:MAG TPA: hypothetical protein VNQ79_20195 [Blastocatellia bacterium]|nr:hypothetical protein [Blastocatellia bacterium]